MSQSAVQPLGVVLDVLPVGVFGGPIQVWHQQYPDNAGAGVVGQIGAFPASATGLNVDISRASQPPGDGIRAGRLAPTRYPELIIASRSGVARAVRP